jgi:hypothetical protein
MPTVTNKPFMLNVAMLSVVMVSAVVPVCIAQCSNVARWAVLSPKIQHHLLLVKSSFEHILKHRYSLRVHSKALHYKRACFRFSI